MGSERRSPCLVFHHHYGAHPAGRRSKCVFVSVAMFLPLYRIYRGVYELSLSLQFTRIVSSSMIPTVFAIEPRSDSLGANVNDELRLLRKSITHKYPVEHIVPTPR